MDKPLKVVVFGGRDFKDLPRAVKVLDKLLSNKARYREIIFLDGGAKGADEINKHYAVLSKNTTKNYPAKWKDLDVPNARIKTNEYGSYNANAGHVRNQLMAEDCDVAVGFWDGKSSGTKDMINRIKKLEKPLRVFTY